MIITLCGGPVPPPPPQQNNKDWVTGWSTFWHHWSITPCIVDTSMSVELNPFWSHNNTSCLWEAPIPVIITQISATTTYIFKYFQLHIVNHVAIIGQILLHAILCTNHCKCMGCKKINSCLIVGSNCNEFCLCDWFVTSNHVWLQWMIIKVYAATINIGIIINIQLSNWYI
jgi:hypothetical protein